MAGLGGVFKSGGIASQLFVWGLLSQIVGALTGPFIGELTQLMNSATTIEPHSPADLAALVVRGYIDQGKANSEGAKSGLDNAHMRQLVELAGQAPTPAELIEGMRRGVLAWDAARSGMPSVIDGIRQGNLKDQWAPLMRELAVQLPSWSDALDAYLEGQLSEAEAKTWFTRAGGDMRAFQWLYDTRGAAPTPDMAGTMANRGIIPWEGAGPRSTSFQQAFLEGPWRNKWEPAMRSLMEYHPPPRTVTALLRSGSISEAVALDLFKKEGLSAEMAAAYVKDAQVKHASTAKELTRSDIELMYADKLITADQAHAMIEKLGFTAANAKLLTSSVDLRRIISNTNSAVTRIRSLFLAHRLSKTAAASTLHKLGVDAVQASELLAIWTLEQAAVIKTLTAAQIETAWHDKIITQNEAETELIAMGYTAYDAWVLLSIKNKGPLPDRPAKQ